MQQQKRRFYEREKSILATAERLLLEAADWDLTLDDLALEMDIAKGTLYKHFSSKDELFLRILIDYEERLAQMNAIDDDPSAKITRMLLQLLLYPKRAMLFHHLEERLAGTATGLNKRFAQLYAVRRERMNGLLGSAKAYLESKNSAMSTRDYLSSVWAIGQGGASLLNSSFYQRYLGRRDTLIASLVDQALRLPLSYPKTPAPKNEKPPSAPKDDFSPFGKLPPPVL